MARYELLVLLVLLWFCSTIHHFRPSTYSMLILMSGLTLSLSKYSGASCNSLTHDITLTALLCKFSFNLNVQILLHFGRLEYCLNMAYWGFGLTLLKDNHILSERLQWYDLVSSVLLHLKMNELDIS